MAARPEVDRRRPAGRDTAIGGTYPQARDARMYWASWAETVRNHKAAVKRMNARRAEGRPVQLRYRRWDGTGTVAVQLQRKIGVTAEERAEVAALRASGLSPADVAERTGSRPGPIALMKDHGPARAGTRRILRPCWRTGRGRRGTCSGSALSCRPISRSGRGASGGGSHGRARRRSASAPETRKS